MSGRGDPRADTCVPWYKGEEFVMWDHPDWTARELHELIPRHSVAGIKAHRTKIGRYNPSRVGVCVVCGERPIFAESAEAFRYGLCKACYLKERERRNQEAAWSVRVRQRAHKNRLRLARETREGNGDGARKRPERGTK